MQKSAVADSWARSSGSCPSCGSGKASGETVQWGTHALHQAHPQGAAQRRPMSHVLGQEDVSFQLVKRERDSARVRTRERPILENVWRVGRPENSGAHRAATPPRCPSLLRRNGQICNLGFLKMHESLRSLPSCGAQGCGGHGRKRCERRPGRAFASRSRGPNDEARTLPARWLARCSPIVPAFYCSQVHLTAVFDRLAEAPSIEHGSVLAAAHGKRLQQRTTTLVLCQHRGRPRIRRL